MAILNSNASDLRHLNGLAITIVRTHVEPTDTIDADSLPMVDVLIDTEPYTLWPDEIADWSEPPEIAAFWERKGGQDQQAIDRVLLSQ